MTVSNIQGTLFTALSALNGRTLSTLSAVNGQTIVSGGFPTFPTITNIWEWWEPAREGLSDNAAMPQLTGQANGRHWTEANGSAQPVYKAAQLNGVGAARFAGNPRCFGTGPDMSAITTAAHVFLIVKIDTDPPLTLDACGLWKLGTDATGNANDTYPFTDGIVRTDALTNARVTMTNPTVSLTNWHILEISNNGTLTATILKTDGTSEALHSSGGKTVALNAAPTLGREPGTLFLQGYIAGMYLADAILTTDRATLLTYINTMFGTGFA